MPDPTLSTEELLLVVLERIQTLEQELAHWEEVYEHLRTQSPEAQATLARVAAAGAPPDPLRALDEACGNVAR